MDGCAERKLFVAWRSESGRIVPVGELLQIAAGEEQTYEFAYLKQAESLAQYRLPGFPDLYQRYTSSTLFPTFSNRLMPRQRSDYDAFVARLGLCGPVDPFEVMERSGGRRQTDRIEVFAGPGLEDGLLQALFFLRGIRHIEGSTERIARLSVGSELGIGRDQDNPVNALALHLLDRHEEVLGFVPDYLVSTVHDLQEHFGNWPTVTIEHMNESDSPFHMRMLCRLSADWPEGYEPFSGPEFSPIA